ncbi:MAG: PRK06851 family protein [Firmicutes bacterium]|jgi:GTPase SAR1 family protein|nr:PRK06851 family protein [Bacillota bacterium]MDH7495043.1 PRK06851 family protein [Bacillota bacterium]
MKSHGRGWIKRVFPGANTPDGFFSFYDHVIRPDANKVVIVKGGPGVGKSTLMRKIGQRFVDMGYDVEFLCCSSDNDSLDGVTVQDLGLALIDGTAPHVVDPKNPGAVDEIMNLGEFWDEKALRACKREIMEANAEVSRHFQRAFRYLKEAKIIHDDWEACSVEALDIGCTNCMAEAVKRDVFGDMPVSPAPGRARRLFASAFSPDGPVHHLRTIVDRLPRRYIVTGEPGTGKSTLVRKVGDAAIERGLDVEFYHCPLDPSKVDHVVIPSLGVALVSSAWPHAFDSSKELDRTVEMNAALDEEVAGRYREIAASAEERFHQALERATEFLHKAKLVHDDMQAYYVRSMDFAAVDRLCEQVLARMLDLERDAAGRASAG